MRALRAEAPGFPRLAVHGLTLRYGDRLALDGLSFELGVGEVFGLLGPNGAGKTSVFHVLLGLARADSGELLLDGRSIPPGDRSLRARLGVVFQEPSLDGRLTARQNLLLAAALYRVPRALARERAAALLGDAGLGDRADEPVARLSGGMRRRIEICRALMSEPEILLLDEPTSGLDEAAFQRTWRQLSALRAERRLTVLVTTHRPEEGERCDRIGIVDGGRLVACDTPERLKATVAGDVVVLVATDPQGVAAAVRERFGIEARLVDGQVVLEHPRGHELIPRLVEALPPGALRSVNLHRPSLGDVFLHVTGKALAEPPGDAP